ncbi:MAG: hypothetical protein ACRER1_07300 [Gammaproteobacteria bacterium]
MKITLSENDLLTLNHTVIRCLVAKGILRKEDLTADLERRGIDDETAFRLVMAIKEMPDQ